MNNQMAVSVLKKLLGLAQEIADDAIHTEAEREIDAKQQRRNLEDAQKMLRILQDKVDVMLGGRSDV